MGEHLEDVLPCNGAGPGPRSLVYPVRVPMDRQTTFLLALGMLVAAALAVGVSGWVLIVRDRAFERAGRVATPGTPDPDHHREGLEGS